MLCCAASATTAISSRRLDTALLCAAKKRGVEKGPAGRSLPEPTLVPGPRVQSKSLSLPAGSKKRHPLSWMPSLFEVKKLSLRELRRATSCLQAVLREFWSCFSLIFWAFPAFCFSVIRYADHKKRPFFIQRQADETHHLLPQTTPLVYCTSLLHRCP